MSRSVIFVCFQLTVLWGVAGLQSKRIPRSWKVCRQSDRNIEKCMKEAGEKALQSLARGSPELGLPPLDPLTVKSLNFTVASSNKDGPFSFQMTLSDVKSSGLSRLRIDVVKQDWKRLVSVVNASTAQPQVVEGKYKVNGRVLLLPVTGEGKIRLVFESYNASVVMGLKRVKKRSVDYVNLDKFDFDFSTTKMTIRMDNLFKGNKALGDNINIVINDHWRDLFTELYPSLKTQIKDTIKLYPRKIFEQIPINELAPR